MLYIVQFVTDFIFYLTTFSIFTSYTMGKFDENLLTKRGNRLLTF